MGDTLIMASSNPQTRKHETMTKTKKQTAEAAYANAYLTANDLVAQLSDLVKNLPATNDTPHWGHVGDLNATNERLQAVIAFINNEEE
jgi:hypothetical protein